MRLRIDQSDPEFRKSLLETVSYCSHLPADAPALKETAALHRELDGLYKKRKLQERWFIKLFGKDPAIDARINEIYKKMSDFESDTLRSNELRPEVSIAELYKEPNEATKLVAHLIEKRSGLVGTVAAAEDVIRKGRLMAFWPAENLRCGASEVGSMGFFDGDNTPPWDTWVAYSNGVLISWVPPLYLDAADKGIDWNPEGCIAWLD